MFSVSKCKYICVQKVLCDLKKALVAHCETSLSQAALEQASISAVAQACSSCTKQTTGMGILCVRLCVCEREKHICTLV